MQMIDLLDHRRGESIWS